MDRKIRPSCEANASPARGGWNKTTLTVSAASPPRAVVQVLQSSVERNKPAVVAARAVCAALRSNARPYQTVKGEGSPQALQVTPASALAKAPWTPIAATVRSPDNSSEEKAPVDATTQGPPSALRKSPWSLAARSV